MKIIALRGDGSKGKTTTLNLVYEELILKKAVSSGKTKVGGNPKDFEDILTYLGKTIAFSTMGDYSYATIDAIDKYENLKVDILLLASNVKFKKPIKKIVTYSHDLVIKSVGLNKSDYPIENQKDALDILSRI